MSTRCPGRDAYGRRVDRRDVTIACAACGEPMPWDGDGLAEHTVCDRCWTLAQDRDRFDRAEREGRDA